MNAPGSFSAFLTSNLQTLSLWIGAICTLGLYTVLYKENKVFRFFEHLFLGLATGYMLSLVWNDVLEPKWWTPFHDGGQGTGQWWWVFALFVGGAFYLIYSKKFNWIARIVIGLFLGQQAGMQFQVFVNDVWPQVVKSFKPVVPHGAIAAAAGHPALKAVSGPDAINNFIFMVILICVMSYFFFSFEQKHLVLKTSAKWGRWLMMFTFGAIFGSTIMARLALLIDRMDYLLNDFGGSQFMGPVVGPRIMFVVLMVLTGLMVYLGMRNGNGETAEGSASDDS